MPELPEVETVVRDLNQKLVGLTIRQVFIYDERVIGHDRLSVFKKKLLQQVVVRVSRRAKLIIVEFKEGGYLLVHLKMTGQLIYCVNNLRSQHQLKDTKVVFKLSNDAHLNFNDQRMFGKLIYTTDLKSVAFLNKVGPEPLGEEFTSAWLSDNIKRRTSPIKPLMMNQHFIAGIGNIYASEILFDARIDPCKPMNRLSKSEVERFCQSTRTILNKAIKFRGSSMRNYRDSDGNKGTFSQFIRVYAKADEPCPVCQSRILKLVQAGRSTFFCKKCQR